jgi:hypothetical protein
MRSGTQCSCRLLRSALPVLAVLTPFASRADSAQGVAPAQAVEEVLVEAPEPRYVAPTTRDRIGRIWAPALIDGKGPYRLVLDTGATRPALVQRVVDEVGLPIAAKALRLRGATGSAVVPGARIATLQIGELMVENATVPIVADAFGGADGVFGGAGLKDMRVVIEFQRDRISIARSHGQAAPPGYSVVRFRPGDARGLSAEVMVGPVKATALLDTGAQVTVGNLALREALARHHGEQDPYDEGIVGVTEDVQQAARARVPGIVVGQLIVRGAEIMFSDLHIFQHWNLGSRPALLIGMDMIGLLDTLIVDYRLGELQIRAAP